jgi:hypothetical protein
MSAKHDAKRLFGVGMLVLVTAGCGGPSLEGTWVENLPDEPGKGATEKLALTLSGDESYSEESTVSKQPNGARCSGSVMFSDAKWTSTDSTITFSATRPKCSSSLECTVDGISLQYHCDKAESFDTKCTYALSGDDDTLIISDCNGDGPNAADTYTRER